MPFTMLPTIPSTMPPTLSIPQASHRVGIEPSSPEPGSGVPSWLSEPGLRVHNLNPNSFVAQKRCDPLRMGMDPRILRVNLSLSFGAWMCLVYRYRRSVTKSRLGFEPRKNKGTELVL